MRLMFWIGSRLLFVLALILLPVVVSRAQDIGTDVFGSTWIQTDATTGSGTISGPIDVSSLGGPFDLMFSGVMPSPTVTQKGAALPAGAQEPPGMVGFMSSFNNNQPGTPHGVHLGWSGATITVMAMDGAETYEIDVALRMTQGNRYGYKFTLTDDNSSVGGTNDAIGTSRVAGWIGDDLGGHRHSGRTIEWLSGPETNTAPATGLQSGGLGNNGAGDNLGITAAPRTDQDAGALPYYVDEIEFRAELDILDVRYTGPARIPGDVDKNGLADSMDYFIIRDNFLMDPALYVEGDLSGDGKVGIEDFRLWKDATGGVLAPVPEPTTITLLAAGLALLGFSVRRRRAGR